MSVLVAVADDSVRDSVLEVAVRLGRGFGEDLYVVHLTEETSAGKETRSLQEEVREKLANSSVDHAVSIEHVERNQPRSGQRVGQQIADITSDVDVSHAVVGHRSKDLLERVSKGNTAFAVADAADVPVTVVPES
ncbi:MAG: universal stress protein UspA related nucleotide-binding protein [uncultured archaeon A07HR60]|nr:MAG: universal stress protein UspA related nucleotide-binding protein [uncultured archaeon A07HR60]